jgi:hypothetical protein
MTKKERILLKHTKYSSLIGIPTATSLNAMDEYAKAFAEWCSKNGYECDANINYWFRSRNCNNGVLKGIKIDELLIKFNSDESEKQD